jgi:hypothetical protein
MVVDVPWVGNKLDVGRHNVGFQAASDLPEHLARAEAFGLNWPPDLFEKLFHD